MKIKYYTVKAEAKCRLCNGTIPKGDWCIGFFQIQIGKYFNLFFHEGCFFRAVEWARERRNDEINEGEGGE